MMNGTTGKTMSKGMSASALLASLMTVVACRIFFSFIQSRTKAMKKLIPQTIHSKVHSQASPSGARGMPYAVAFEPPTLA
jgi:hypothetical protein